MTTTQPDSVSFNMRIPREMDDLLARIAKRDDRSKAYIVRQAIMYMAKYCPDYADILEEPTCTQD